VSDDGLPAWTAARNKLEFVKWVRLLSGLVQTAPAGWEVWQQTRDAQEVLEKLARRVGFDRAPIERRTETFTRVTDRGRERHERHYVVAREPTGSTIAERFDGVVDYLDSTPHLIEGVRGGLPDPEFREQVLSRLRLWLDALGECPEPPAAPDGAVD